MNAKTAVSILTIYLITYVILFVTGFSVTIAMYMFLTSPVLLVWMVYSVLTDEQYKYPELGEDEEWGYRDKAKNELGMF
jgi:hypothetical protein